MHDVASAPTETLFFPAVSLPVAPVLDEHRSYCVRRIFCVGRNYADHAKEMGVEVDREAPFYFTKSPLTLVHSGATVPYPAGTENYHYEMELVAAIGRPAWKIAPDAAVQTVFGYAAGLDMTRRDLQLAARALQRPWDLGKDFEKSAVIAPLTRVESFQPAGQRISLSVNGAVRQDAKLSDLIWSIGELISHLSHFYHLEPGDLIYTGTPAGVGPVVSGDRILGEIEGLSPVELAIGAPE